MRLPNHSRPGLAPLLCLCAIAMLMVLRPTGDVLAQDKDRPKADVQPQAQDDAVAQAIEVINKAKNGLVINREGMYVDLEGKVCLRTAEFLEMFACTPDTREHESLMTIKAQPSMIHTALLLLGQEPGKPLHYERVENPPKLIPPSGPKVRLYIVTKVAGKDREVPANRWIRNTTNDQMMKDNVWLFAGSVTTTIDLPGNDKEKGKTEKVYLADVNGSAISLVNFGDDLLTLPNKMTQDNNSHGKAWAPRTEAIPRVGSEVVLRLRVEPKAAEPDKSAKDKPAEAEKPQ